MKQLSGQDAAFLYAETSTTPMHIGSISILDPSTAPGGKVRFKQILEHLTERVHLADHLRQKVVRVPFDADYPYWINDGTFDPEFHIRHIALPQPGDWRQFCILLSRLFSRGLDLGRPLWEVYVIEGLDNIEGFPKGCFALLTKTHHSAIDGASSAEIGTAICDFSPTPEIRIDKNPTWTPETPPSDLELMTRAHFNNMAQPKKLYDLIQKSLPTYRNAMSRIKQGELSVPSEAPRTRFNGTVSQHRSYEAITFTLDDVKKIRGLYAGVTVNDVVVTVVGGALRRYLLDKKELPETTLIAQCPINVRDENDTAGGNKVANMSVEIGTHIADAMQRLIHVHTSATNGKEFTRAVGAKSMVELTNAMSSNLMSTGSRVATEFNLASEMTPTYNCVITNVPGPQVPLYIKGAKIIGGFGMGPIVNGNALFHTVGSYCGVISLCATSCREMLPDPAFYRECLEASFAELLALTKPIEKKQDAILDTQVKKQKSSAAKPVIKQKAKKIAQTKPAIKSSTVEINKAEQSKAELAKPAIKQEEKKSTPVKAVVKKSIAEANTTNVSKVALVKPVVEKTTNKPSQDKVVVENTVVEAINVNKSKVVPVKPTVEKKTNKPSQEKAVAKSSVARVGNTDNKKVVPIKPKRKKKK
jgi:WS/DGAT/MGAT family acyltransferase